MKESFEILIIGGGIVGLTTARELFKRGYRSIAVLEKESKLGKHSSGKNSGVLHAGFYYSSESLKAKICAAGSRELFNYAQEHKIPVKKTGKVVVATDEASLSQIEVLLNRAKTNQIRLEKIDSQQLAELEPNAITQGNQALYSPDTAVIDSHAVLNHLEQELTSAGVEVLKDSEVDEISVRDREVRSRRRVFTYGHLINCAGLHADRIAHWMGVGKDYRILPFKGVYRKLTEEAARRFRGSIYPIPDLRVPFLGVHITRNIFDQVLIGPTAIPAFGRENYGLFQGINLLEAPVMAKNLLRMMASNTQGMRQLVKEELSRYRSKQFLMAAQKLSPSLKAEDLTKEGKVGLRAQLVDLKKGSLQMDFLIESGPNSTHVLNAISPAFTASFAFARLISERVEGTKKEKSPSLGDAHL